MILSESLWPGMTRPGFAHKTLVPISRDDRDFFPATKAGKWLPRLEVSAASLLAAKASLQTLEARVPGMTDTLASQAIRDSELRDDTGCWLIDSHDMEGSVHREALRQIATLDMGGPPLEDLSDVDSLRVCDEPGCLNARHFDLTHAVKNRDRLLRVDPRNYEQIADGMIMPVWEIDEAEPIVLPSLDASIVSLRALQHRCTPFIDDPRQAPLSPNAISKITIDETTGCWVTRTYYVKPAVFEKGFMYDGYGRLSYGPSLKAEGWPVGPRMAHRVVWAASGRALKRGMVLNHECGFHPCCNPDHLTQVTSRENNIHARRMTSALRGMIE